MTRYKIILSVFFCVQAVVGLAQKFDLEKSIINGKAIYEANCISCHMENGEGLAGVFPPLAKNPNLKIKDRLVKVILNGQSGTIRVNGVEYNGEMAPVPMSDSEVADVLNYIRNSWGEKNSAILPAEVQQLLKQK